MSEFKKGDEVIINNPTAADPKWRTGTGTVTGEMGGPFTGFVMVRHHKNNEIGGFAIETLTLAKLPGITYDE